MADYEKMSDAELNAEDWRPAVGYDGIEVNPLGGMRSWRSRHGRRDSPIPLNLCTNSYGYRYYYARARDVGRPQIVMVARAVLEAFVGPPPTPSHQAAHINGIRTDNRVTNLRWASCAENNADKIVHGTLPLGERVPTSRLTTAQVAEIKSMGIVRGTADAQIAAKRFGVSLSTINRVLSGTHWGHVSALAAVEAKENTNA